MKQINRGIVASQMAWSPDNGKLLLSGTKPIEFVKSNDGITQKIQNLVIEFKQLRN
jgi:hypothetical protein